MDNEKLERWIDGIAGFIVWSKAHGEDLESVLATLVYHDIPGIRSYIDDPEGPASFFFTKKQWVRKIHCSTNQKGIAQTRLKPLMHPNRDDGMDISVWDEKETWMVLMGKMRDADKKLFYSSSRSGSIRRDFTSEHFSHFLATAQHGTGRIPVPRPDMSKIPDDDDFFLEVNGIKFSRWEILTLINASNNHLW